MVTFENIHEDWIQGMEMRSVWRLQDY